MQTASLELCRELYRLSKWINTDYYWVLDMDSGEPWIEYGKRMNGLSCPAYDLGYLLRKLRWYDITNNGVLLSVYVYDGKADKYITIEESPSRLEDAAAKLAIELLKQGILTKEGAL